MYPLNVDACNTCINISDRYFFFFSRKPKRCTLSKNLIALLSFGGVPKDFFLNILEKALEEARTILVDRSEALQCTSCNSILLLYD